MWPPLLEATLLVQGFVDWCALLGLTIHLGKTQLWCNTHKQPRSVNLALRDGPLKLTSRSTFRIVGLELGVSDLATSAVHSEPRVAKALLSGKRLTRLELPAGVAAVLYRSVVLPQALYGCELRTIPKHALKAVALQGRTIVPTRAPLHLSRYRAAEVVSGLPLGSCAVRDPFQEVHMRRIRWLWTLANQTGLVGTVHRFLAAPEGSGWAEPTPALASALSFTRWRLVVNHSSPRCVSWPLLAPEPSYPGEISLDPLPDHPPVGSAWTDGSIRVDGGAAALQQPSDLSFKVRVSTPHSSTQCELVALSLLPRFPAVSPRVLTDSLCSLQLLKSWAHRPLTTIMTCQERVEVRTVLYQWQGRSAPLLEKVRAHDSEACRLCLPPTHDLAPNPL